MLFHFHLMKGAFLQKKQKCFTTEKKFSHFFQTLLNKTNVQKGMRCLLCHNMKLKGRSLADANWFYSVGKKF